MCNVRTITYSCGHTIPFRLSTCRGTFTYCTRKSPTGSFPSCRSAPLLTFVSRQPCGACAKAAEEKWLEEKIAKLRLEHVSTTDGDDWVAEPSTELVDAEAALTRQIWRLEEVYPSQSHFKKDLRPEKGPLPTRSTSLLSRPVYPSDIVLQPSVNKNAALSGWDYESWGEGWTDLGQEIAENDAERVAANLPAFTDCGFDCCEEGVEEGMEQLEEEIFSAMDWGVATTDVLLPSGDEGWAGKEEEGADAGDELVEERLGRDVKGEVVGTVEVGQVGEKVDEKIEDQQLEPIMQSTKPEPSTQSTQDSPLPKENTALHRRNTRPSSTERSQQTKSLETCQAHRPFLNFAVSV